MLRKIIASLREGSFRANSPIFIELLIAERASSSGINNHDNNVAESNRIVAEGYFFAETALKL